MKTKKSLLSIGLVIICISQILAHFTALPDFVLGLAMGVGIGVILLALSKRKSTAV